MAEKKELSASIVASKDVGTLPPRISIRRNSDDTIILKFSESIAADISRVETSEGEIPAEILTKIVSRAAEFGRVGASVRGCNDKCNKDCLW